MLIKPEIEKFARIKVVGVGGGGSNAIRNMMEEQSIQGVEFVAVNTDAQALSICPAPTKIQVGRQLTGGLGAGGYPDIGRQAAEENRDELEEKLSNADLVFITGGMGGGTCTGGSSIIAEIAKKSGALTVGVVTKPFSFEGARRRINAEEGVVALKEKVDTLITIPNDRLLEIADKTITLLEAFKLADSVLGQSVQGISDIIVVPGLINRDFADVRSVMQDAGSALMGIGRASGKEDRAVIAARAAIESPLLDASIKGAKGVLFNVTGGPDLTLAEINEAASLVAEAVDPDANIIWGAQIDEGLSDSIKITVIATGFNEVQQKVQEVKETTEKVMGEGKDQLEIPAFMRQK